MTSTRLSAGDQEGRLRAARLASQGLTTPDAASPEAVVTRLLAVQAQDPRAARLAIRARSTGLTAGDVDAALTDRRSLVIAWLNRSTLHLVTAEDYWWLHQLTAPRQATTNATRLRQEGVSEQDAVRGIDVITTAVTTDGPQTRNQLRDRLDAAGVPTAGQALVHLLLATSIAHQLVRGPVVDGQHAFVHAPTWLGTPRAIDRDEALARLGERYLRGHGPADAGDLAKWSGLALGECRRALAAVADQTRDPGATGLPTPRLLGGFDPILHGWASRELFVGDQGAVVTSNGIFRPTALVEGRVVATWTMPAGRIELKPIAPIPRAALAALEDEADDVARFLRPA